MTNAERILAQPPTWKGRPWVELHPAHVRNIAAMIERQLRALGYDPDAFRPDVDLSKVPARVVAAAAYRRAALVFLGQVC